MRLWATIITKPSLPGLLEIWDPYPFCRRLCHSKSDGPPGRSGCFRYLQNLCWTLFQDPHPHSTHEGHRGNGDRPCRVNHSWNDLGSRNFYGFLLAFDGSHWGHHLDRKGHDKAGGARHHARIGFKLYPGRVRDDEGATFLCYRGVVLTLLLLNNKRFPAMLVLLGMDW